jgi:hypothetical protein
MIVFTDKAPCSLVEADGRFKSGHCLQHPAVTMEALCTFETSVNFYESTRRSIPENCNLRIFWKFIFGALLKFYTFYTTAYSHFCTCDWAGKAKPTAPTRGEFSMRHHPAWQQPDTPSSLKSLPADNSHVIDPIYKGQGPCYERRNCTPPPWSHWRHL